MIIYFHEKEYSTFKWDEYTIRGFLTKTSTNNSDIAWFYLDDIIKACYLDENFDFNEAISKIDSKDLSYANYKNEYLRVINSVGLVDLYYKNENKYYHTIQLERLKALNVYIANIVYRSWKQKLEGLTTDNSKIVSEINKLNNIIEKIKTENTLLKEKNEKLSTKISNIKTELRNFINSL